SPGKDVAEVRRGDWLMPEREGRARLSGKLGAIELESGAQLLIEDPGYFRVRLESGRAHLSGSVVLTHLVGVVNVLGGKAEVESRAAGLDVRCLEGTLKVASSAGGMELAA